MKRLLALVLAVLVALPAAQAQERRAFSQAELDQMLAPVALYPDSLLSQVLMASTYPLEVVEAARWTRSYPGLKGDEAVRAVQDKEWDPSVKSLVAFPNLLARMDEQLDWTRRLGDAFLAQESQVMETVQQLRQRAQAAGNLAPDERQSVVTESGSIAIEPANPRVVYVPYYDPYVVYGSWWWPAYPPVVWAPWPGYAVARPGFWWGMGIGVTAGFFYGAVHWPGRYVTVAHVNNYYVKPGYGWKQPLHYKPVQPGRWQHNDWHRHGVGQRHEQRRADFRAAQAMPPAFRAASQQQPANGPRSVGRWEGRPEHGAQPRTPPRIEAPRQQPPGGPRDVGRHEGRPEHRVQPRFEAPRVQPSQPRVQPGVQPTQPRVQQAPRVQQPAPRMQAPAPRMQAPAPRMEMRGGAGGWRGGNGGNAGGARRG